MLLLREGPRASRGQRDAFLGHWAGRESRCWGGGYRTTEPPKGGRGRAWPRGWDRTRINPGGPRTPTPVLWARAGLKGTGVSARCILDSVPQVSLPPLPNDPSVTRLSQLSPSLLGLHGGPCWACVLVFTDLDSRGPHKTHVSRAPALG